MARQFANFDKINMMDFIPFERGYHFLTITGHKEETNKNGKDTDVFAVTSDTGATANFTLYYQENCLWTYKKLMHCCGAKVDKMTGNQSINLSNLIGKRFGAFVEVEETEKFDEEKGQVVTKKYPKIDAGKIYTEEKVEELMKSAVKETAKASNNDLSNWGSSANANDDMTPIEDGDVPF